MGRESVEARRRRQSSPAFNANRKAYREKNREALKLVRHLGISIEEARQLVQMSQSRDEHVSTSVHP